jgi:hypothetical protein
MTLIHALGRVPDSGWSEGPNLAKALVMAELARIVAQGDAVTTAVESGALELRLATGEIYHLGEETVTRVA